MGNCLTKTKVTTEAQSSNTSCVERRSWRNIIMKRLRLGNLSARVDVSPAEETSDVNNTASVDTESISSVKSDISAIQKIDSNEIDKDTASVLIHFYARVEQEPTGANEVEPESSILALRRDSPYFSSQESLYEGFEDTGSDGEQTIDEEINSEDDSCTDTPNTPASSEFLKSGEQKQTVKGMSSSDASNTKLTESNSCYGVVKPECHYFASNVASGYNAFDGSDDTIEEEIPIEEISGETNLEMTQSSDKIGTGHVAMDNCAVEQAIKRMYLLKRTLTDPETKLKYENTVEAIGVPRCVAKNISVQQKLNGRETSSCPDFSVCTKVSQESEPSTSNDGSYKLPTDTTSVMAFRRTTLSESKQSIVSEELKTKISLTSVKSLEKIETFKAKSDCSFNIYVRAAEPDGEPREILVRATSKQVKDGAARMFVKSLKNVADPVSHFDPYGHKLGNTKRHVHTNSGLTLTEKTPYVKWTQRQGTVSNIHLTKVPRFYDPPPKKQNAREQFGLENLQKYKIKVQCREIERIKVDEDQFPGILPPKILEHWKKKKQEKKLVH